MIAAASAVRASANRMPGIEQKVARIAAQTGRYMDVCCTTGTSDRRIRDS